MPLLIPMPLSFIKSSSSAVLSRSRSRCQIIILLRNASILSRQMSLEEMLISLEAIQLMQFVCMVSQTNIAVNQKNKYSFNFFPSIIFCAYFQGSHWIGKTELGKQLTTNIEGFHVDNLLFIMCDSSFINESLAQAYQKINGELDTNLGLCAKLLSLVDNLILHRTRHSSQHPWVVFIDDFNASELRNQSFVACIEALCDRISGIPSIKLIITTETDAATLLANSNIDNLHISEITGFCHTDIDAYLRISSIDFGEALSKKYTTKEGDEVSLRTTLGRNPRHWYRFVSYCEEHTVRYLQIIQVL